MDDKAYLVALGAKIMALRKAKGLTQAELAHLLGANHPQEIGRIEAGTVNSTINMLRKIAKELDVKVGELVEIN